MKLEIVQDSVATEVDLRDGIFTLGGADADAVRIPGLAPGLLAACIEGEQVIVETSEPLAFDGVRSPPRLRRLWLPGETITAAPGIAIRRPAERRAAQVATAAVLRDLLELSPDAAVEDGPSLTCLTGLDLGRTFALADGETVIGRGLQVAVRIRERSVSRRHARVWVGAGGVTLTDLGSPNGVAVNGEPVRHERPLLPGDLIEIGRALLKYRAPPRPAEPPKQGPASEPDTYACADVPAPRASRRLEWLAFVAAALVAVAGAALSWRLAP